MKLISDCGRARKHCNNAIMLFKIMEGAKSVGTETEFVNLFGLNSKNYFSLNACILKNIKSFGYCKLNDELQPLIVSIVQLDVIVLGSPIYYGILSSQMRNFTDGLLYQYHDNSGTRKNLKSKILI